MDQERLRAQLKFKVLCLGAGESGKSTVIKQLRLIHHGKLSSEADAKAQVAVLHENTLQCIQALLKHVSKLGASYDDVEVTAAAERVAVAGTPTVEGDFEFVMLPDLAEDITRVWRHPVTQAAYARRSDFWILDGADYYLEHARRFAAEGFVPTEEDLIMARARTTGIVTTEFASDELDWTVVDVGGQRSERKKWINCFDDVKAVLFVVNLAGYNSVLFEDDKVVRMHEDLNLFASVTAEPVFANTPIFLFFNKKDLFEERLRTQGLRVCFPDFEGDDRDVGRCLDYLAAQFQKRVAPARTGQPIAHSVIAARFKKDVQYAFMDVKEQLINMHKKTIVRVRAELKREEAKKHPK